MLSINYHPNNLDIEQTVWTKHIVLINDEDRRMMLAKLYLKLQIAESPAPPFLMTQSDGVARYCYPQESGITILL